MLILFKRNLFSVFLALSAGLLASAGIASASERGFAPIPVNYSLLEPPRFFTRSNDVSQSSPVKIEWSGYVGLEARIFPDDPLFPVQQGDSSSIAFQPEYYREWNDGRSSLTIEPFLRIDSGDDERSHADIRELMWLTVGDDWELRAGVGKVFWGVTESQHLVDIINQTDLVENIDGEEKLGQMMIDLSLIRDWGTLDLFILPGFRERTFPGMEGRLRTPLVVDTDQANYESSREEKRIDYAIRWFNLLGDWEVGLAYFNGTSRIPQFVQTGSVLTPYYALLQQSSLDAQLTLDAWLWKIEAVSRRIEGEYSSALTGGFEYTQAALWDSDVDLGLLVEYLFDDQGTLALTPFEDDVLFGARLALNDIQGSELLAGVIQDLDSDTMAYLLEASRRIGDSWKLEVEVRLYDNVATDDFLYAFRQDDLIQMELRRYF